MSTEPRRGPLIAAGLLLGLGFGGLAHGIVFHQILQSHQTMSAWLPPGNLWDLKLNHFIDGVFLAAMWWVLLLGAALLFGAGRGPQRWWSGRGLLGAALLGWGLFEVMDGIVCHYMLNLHHLMDQSSDPRIADAAVLAAGLLLMLLGGLLVRRAVQEPRSR